MASNIQIMFVKGYELRIQWYTKVKVVFGTEPKSCITPILMFVIGFWYMAPEQYVPKTFSRLKELKSISHVLPQDHSLTFWGRIWSSLWLTFQYNNFANRFIRGGLARSKRRIRKSHASVPGERGQPLAWPQQEKPKSVQNHSASDPDGKIWFLKDVCNETTTFGVVLESKYLLGTT